MKQTNEGQVRAIDTPGKQKKLGNVREEGGTNFLQLCCGQMALVKMVTFEVPSCQYSL